MPAGWHDHLDLLCTVQHVRIGDDIALGIYDHARTDGSLSPNNDVRLSSIAFLSGSITRDHDLNDARGDMSNECLDRIVELVQGIGCTRALRSLARQARRRHEGHHAQESHDPLVANGSHPVDIV